jgi:hypothetical protein
LAVGDVRLVGSSFAGAVVATGRDDAGHGWFDVDESVQAGPRYAALRLRFADSTERAYNVTAVEARPDAAGSRVRVAETAGFRQADGRVEFSSFPQRTVTGVKVNYWLSACMSFTAP